MVFIEGNIPSLKNSKVKTSRGVFHSKTVKKFLQQIGILKYSASKKEVIFYKTRDCKFPYDELKKEIGNKKNSQLKIGFHFVRNSKRKFDFHNAVQIVADLLVAFDLIEDDNMDYFIPIPFKINKEYYSYNPDNPGVFIKIY